MTSDGHVSLADVVNMASDVLRDVEAGTLRAGQVEARAVEVCRETFGQVNGPGDVLWPLQCDVARAVLERGGVTAAELREWVAVMDRREGLPKT